MNVVIEGMVGLTIKVGGSFVTINAAGVQIVGPMVTINSGGSPLSGPGATVVSPLAAALPLAADKAKPGELKQYQSTGTTDAPAFGPQSDAPAHDRNSEENKDKKSWIEIVLVDEEGKPMAGESYRITLPDGTSVAEGSLDENGFARVDNIDPGTCKVTFPKLDKDAWEEA
jgi:type VI secretion system secreted protein VgrG